MDYGPYIAILKTMLGDIPRKHDRFQFIEKSMPSERFIQAGKVQGKGLTLQENVLFGKLGIRCRSIQTDEVESLKIGIV